MIPALQPDTESDFQAGGESDTDFSNKWNRNACRDAMILALYLGSESDFGNSR